MDKIKAICAELNITQNELAKMLGIHYTTFSKWKDAIPKNSEITLDLLLENHRLKNKLAKINDAINILKNLDNF
ncbi:DNA-binding transcriptional regulator [Campylobacter vicugnae]|uniref:helix-turn-helix domain-containing protein n=1 Tax=Campylobacter vicugnae TaxID=1660076 RepID=UPI000A3590CA|nr:helix-turn-helix transcriptional regulator [Campylobacter sp. RM8835]